MSAQRQLTGTNGAWTTHGARSEAQIRPRARTAKQRLLRQVGLSAAQLDGVARGYLDNWARAQAKVELMDRYLEQRGLVDQDGNLPGFMATYFAALNSARLALSKLEGHLKARSPEDPFAQYIDVEEGDR